MTKRRQFVRLCLAGTATGLAGCAARSDDPGSNESNSNRNRSELIDDWEYDPDEDREDGGTTGVSYEMDADEAADGESIGLAAGGAADVGTFRRNVYEGYLPIPESLAYEGLFHEYYFDTGGDGSCSSLFCPTYTPAVSPDPLSGERERFLSVGLESGLSQSAFERPPLNLVIVLDISGSMNSSFDDYYYDAYGNERRAEGDTTRPKIDVAKEALVDLTHQLRPEDRLGVVLFNHDAYLAKPLHKIEKTDMDAIREHIREDVVAGGGTNVSAAMDLSEAVMAEVEPGDANEYENRSILLTDAQVNMGETDADELRTGLENNAERGHHTTVVGVGVDFNAELIGQITGVRGANYYSVYSEDEFERRLGEEFEYMVTPLVYDLSLELEADGYEIARVYGTGDEESPRNTGELMHVHTLFPSPRTDGEAKGGVVLVQVERTDEARSDERSLSLEATWETRDGETKSTTEDVSIPDVDGDDHYGSDAIRKAILLARHADLLKNWTIHERDADLVEDANEGGGIGEPPADGLGRWEQQSDPLTLTEPYDERIRTFRGHVADETQAIGDDDLERELELLDAILEAGARE